jgi:hypothetical protein
MKGYGLWVIGYGLWIYLTANYSNLTKLRRSIGGELLELGLRRLFFTLIAVNYSLIILLFGRITRIGATQVVLFSCCAKSGKSGKLFPPTAVIVRVRGWVNLVDFFGIAAARDGFILLLREIW